MEFDYELIETRKNYWPDTATHLPDDDRSGEVDDYVTEDERSSAHEDESSSERSENDVTENEIMSRMAGGREFDSFSRGPESCR